MAEYLFLYCTLRLRLHVKGIVKVDRICLDNVKILCFLIYMQVLETVLRFYTGGVRIRLNHYFLIIANIEPG